MKTLKKHKSRVLPGPGSATALDQLISGSRAVALPGPAGYFAVLVFPYGRVQHTPAQDRKNPVSKKEETGLEEGGEADG
jgi:hypothetical protein